MADESVTEQMKDLKMDEKKVSDVHEVSWLANVSELKKSSGDGHSMLLSKPLMRNFF